MEIINRLTKKFNNSPHSPVSQSPSRHRNAKSKQSKANSTLDQDDQLMLQQIKMADAFEKELMMELNKQNKDFKELMPNMTMDQIQLNLKPATRPNLSPAPNVFNLDNIECMTRG